MIAGKWTYRSYLNDPALVAGKAQKALANIFGEGVFDLAAADDTAVRGVFDMGGGYALDLTGKVERSSDGTISVRLSGIGRAGTRTDGWEYDYAAVTPAGPPSSAPSRMTVDRLASPPLS